jgi:hypothetical protein
MAFFSLVKKIGPVRISKGLATKYDQEIVFLKMSWKFVVMETLFEI